MSQNPSPNDRVRQEVVADGAVVAVSGSFSGSGAANKSKTLPTVP
ncbi:hypothetical protein AAGW05_17080 [Arthrobacter sp. LAPM80]